MALHHMGSASQCIMCKKKQASSYVDEISLNDGAPVLPLRHVPADMLPPQLPVPQQRHLEQRLHCKLHVVATARSTAKHVGRPSSWGERGGWFFPQHLETRPRPRPLLQVRARACFFRLRSRVRVRKAALPAPKPLKAAITCQYICGPRGVPSSFVLPPLASDTYQSRGFGCSSYSSYSRYSSVMV